MPAITPETDPVIEEIHQTRRAIAAKFGGDVTAIMDDARQRQAAEGRAVWCARQTTRPEPNAAPGRAM